MVKCNVSTGKKSCNHLLKNIVILFFVCFQLFFSSISYANIDENEVVDVNSIKKQTVETVATTAEELKLNAKIGLIYDRTSKKIIYEKNGLKQVPMASTTKIMTSIIVLENANLNDTVTISKNAAGTGGSRLGLKVNNKVTVNDLLYGLMLKSGNDAAVALAEHVGGSVTKFAELMNNKAKELGLVNSSFVTPHGLDKQNHYTTAYELACMADYALNIPKFKQIVGTKTYNVTISGQTKTISNTNELLGNLIGIYGVKTGFTNGAGRCLVTACKRGELDIITVVLGADTKKIRTTDSIKLIEYAYKNYQIVNVEEIVEKQFENWKYLNQNRIYINKGKQNYITLEIEKMQNAKIAVKNNEIDSITLEINSLYYLEAPVEQKQTIATAKVKIGNEVIEILNIYSATAIEKKGIYDYFKQFLTIVQNMC